MQVLNIQDSLKVPIFQLKTISLNIEFGEMIDVGFLICLGIGTFEKKLLSVPTSVYLVLKSTKQSYEFYFQGKTDSST